MAKGISIHVGVNVPPADLELQPLGGCVNDATEMQKLAKARGFIGLNDNEPLLMLNADATHNDVIAKLQQAAQMLDAGDIFLFTFAGHGTSTAGSMFEPSGDGRDETIVMSDKFVLDDVLRRDVWPRFKAGVRVVMIADSCHSGTVAMSAVDDLEDGVSPESTRRYLLEDEDGAAGNGDGPIVSGLRAVPQDKAVEHFQREAAFYSQVNPPSSTPDAEPIQAKVILLAACKEFQKTRESTIDEKTHGVYTRALLNTWGANNTLTYEGLVNALKLQLSPQTPMLMLVESTSSFANTEAFKI